MKAEEFFFLDLNEKDLQIAKNMLHYIEIVKSTI